jgi:hypothetical protein
LTAVHRLQGFLDKSQPREIAFVQVIEELSVVADRGQIAFVFRVLDLDFFRSGPVTVDRFDQVLAFGRQSAADVFDLLCVHFRSSCSSNQIIANERCECKPDAERERDSAKHQAWAQPSRKVSWRLLPISGTPAVQNCTVAENASSVQNHVRPRHFGGTHSRSEPTVAVCAGEGLSNCVQLSLQLTCTVAIERESEARGPRSSKQENERLRMQGAAIKK